MDKLRCELQEVFRDVFDDSEMVISDEMTAADVDGWDSLSHIMIISSIEKRFKIRFKLKELNSLNNLKGLVDLIILKQSS